MSQNLCSLISWHYKHWLLMLSLIHSAHAIVYQHPYDGFALEPVPYQVSFQYTDTYGNRVHFCSGSIISSSYALSAAHCFVTMNLNRVRVAVGSNRLNLTRRAKAGETHTVTKAYIHEYFQPLHGYDAALLRVSPKFKLDGVTVGQIAFANKKPPPPNALGYLVSWGHMSIDAVHDLRLVSFRTISVEECWQRGFSYTSHKDLCAYGYKSDGHGACDGDSGTGLVSPKLNMLYGILSYGRRPCEPRRIYVFTSTHSIYEWIINKVKS